MLIAEGVAHLTTPHRRPSNATIAKGLVLDLVLAEALSLPQRQRVYLTGQRPTDPILAHTVDTVATERRPPRLPALIRKLADPHATTAPPEPIGALLHQLAGIARRGNDQLDAVARIQTRATRRPQSTAETVQRLVSELLTGAHSIDSTEPSLYLLGGLSLHDDLVRGLVNPGALDHARHQAAAIATGQAQPTEASPPLRHAATTVLPALTG